MQIADYRIKHLGRARLPTEGADVYTWKASNFTGFLVTNPDIQSWPRGEEGELVEPSLSLEQTTIEIMNTLELLVRNV